MTDWLDMEAAAFPEDWHRARERYARRIAGGVGGIKCGACGVMCKDKGRNWRGYLGREDDDSLCVVVMCPECARVEVDDR